MLQSLACPNCGAALPDPAGGAAVRCLYCGALAALPRAEAPAAPQPDPLVPDPSLTEVAALLREGKRVTATMRYREITGAELQEARKAIDAFLAGQPLRRPNKLGENYR